MLSALGLEAGLALRFWWRGTFQKKQRKLEKLMWPFGRNDFRLCLESFRSFGDVTASLNQFGFLPYFYAAHAYVIAIQILNSKKQTFDVGAQIAA